SPTNLQRSLKRTKATKAMALKATVPKPTGTKAKITVNRTNSKIRRDARANLLGREPVARPAHEMEHQIKAQTNNPIEMKAIKLSPIQWFVDDPFAVTVKEALKKVDSRRPTNANDKKQGVAAAAALTCRGTRGLRPNRNPLVNF